MVQKNNIKNQEQGKKSASLDQLFTSKDRKYLRLRYRLRLSQTSSKRKILYVLYQAQNIASNYLHKDNIDSMGEYLLDFALNMGIIHKKQNSSEENDSEVKYVISENLDFISTTALHNYTNISNKTVLYHLSDLEKFTLDKKKTIDDDNEGLVLIKSKLNKKRKYIALTEDGVKVCSVLFNEGYTEMFSIEDEIEKYIKFFNDNSKIKAISKEIDVQVNSIEEFINGFLKVFSIEQIYRTFKDKKIPLEDKIRLMDQTIEREFKSKGVKEPIVFFQGARPSLEYLLERKNKLNEILKKLRKNAKTANNIIYALRRLTRNLLRAENEKIIDGIQVLRKKFNEDIIDLSQILENSKNIRERLQDIHEQEKFLKSKTTIRGITFAVSESLGLSNI